jgi:hypothetical protein
MIKIFFYRAMLQVQLDLIDSRPTQFIQPITVNLSWVKAELTNTQLYPESLF